MIQGVCKDCGNGTLNNEIVQAFEFGVEDETEFYVRCRRCGSYHVDVIA